tara:strand:- start:1625 stop:1732 length:108 start_codon:yes stop_codon:yes gene_type:complete
MTDLLVTIGSGTVVLVGVAIISTVLFYLFVDTDWD